MTKKSLNKLLSVILALAICSATVFGCLITASAANVTCYEWSEGTASEDLTSATIDLTITAPAELSDGIIAGKFTLNADSALKLNKIEITGGTRTDDSAFSASDFGDADKNGYGDVSSNNGTCLFETSEPYNSVIFKLTFSFVGGTEKYSISIADSSLSLTGPYDGEFNYSGAATTGVINTGCDHVFDVTGLTPITNTVEGYHVYTNVKCKNCDVVNEYQVVPATELKNVIYWNGSSSEPTAQDADGNYIISTAAELAWIVSRTDESATSGKSYKVADGIDAIVLQPKSDAAKAIMDLADYAQTKAYFDTTLNTSKVRWVTTHNNCFAGNFDGNGVEIYGLYGNGDTGSKGVFGKIKPGITLKNFAVKNSYILNGDHKVGAVFGAPSSTINDAFITVEKVIVSGCHISSNLDKSNGNVWNVGVMAGTSIGAGYGVVIKNCLVYNNIAVNTKDATVEYGLVGKLSDTVRNRIQSSIILGCVPYSLASDQGNPTKPAVFDKVYTDAIDYELSRTWPVAVVNGSAAWADYEGKIISVHRDDVKGDSSIIADLNNANSSNVWFAGANGGYPTFDKAVAAQKSVVYVTSDINDPSGAWAKVTGEGTEANPYVISTIGQLRNVVQNSTTESTKGNFYKIDPTIGTMVMQTESYINTVAGSLDAFLKLDAEGTSAALSNSTNRTRWNSGSNNGYDGFAGTIDFSGVTICGMYNENGGLFAVTREATIKNLIVSNNYIKSTWYNGNVVGMVQNESATEYTKLTLSNIIVKNCYQHTTANGYANTGVLVGTMQHANKVRLDVRNILTYGNISKGTNSSTDSTLKDCALFGTLQSSWNGDSNVDNYGEDDNAYLEDIVTLDCVPYPTQTVNNHMTKKAYWHDSIYTTHYDSNCAPNTAPEAELSAITAIKQISASDAKGAAAKAAMPDLDWSVWSYDGNGGYPTPVSQAISTNSQYNLNLKAANIDYNNDGSFNFNFYYEPNPSDIKPVLYVGRKNAVDFNKITESTVITQEMIDATESYQDAGLVAGTLRYTIKNLSTREIDNVLLPTAVAKNGTSTVWGKTEQISVADYANKVMNSTDAKITAADKQVAAALVNYGTAAATALATAAPSATGKKVVYTTTTNKEPDSTFTDETHGAGTEDNPYIISTPGQLRYIVQNSTTGSTKGKFYKIDPTIGTMVLQTESYITSVAGSLDAFLALDAERTKKALSNEANRQTWQSRLPNDNNNGTFDAFAGTIDFSGVTICGMYNTDGGLFACARAATIKNLCLSNNYLTSKDYCGNLIGCVRTTSDVAPVTYLTIDTVEIKNCYQENTGSNGYARTGVLLGFHEFSYYIGLKVSNILTYGNISKGTTSKTDSTLKDCALYGSLAGGWNGQDTKRPVAERVDNSYFEDIVTLDCVPYPTQSVNNQMTRKAYWHDSIYTTRYDANYKPNTDDKELSAITAIKRISEEDAKGAAAKAAMPDLDWSSTWTMGTRNDYPSPIPTVATLKESKTIYWEEGKTDSTLADNGETGTAEDPIIIDSAAELHQLARNSTYASTNGKYYKVADGISKIVLQPEGNEAILTLANAAAVENYFSNTSGKNLQQWAKGIGYRDKEFCGNFDGNGVEIYGMYQTATDNTNGLFPLSDAGAVFKNFALKNSYVANTSTNYSGAFVIGKTPGAGIGANVEGIITVENVAVINNYMNRTSNNHNHAGVLTGELTDTALVKNCLIYGNDATYTYNDVTYDVPMAGAAHGGMGYQDYMKDMGVIQYGNYACYTVINSIILGTTPYNLNNSGWRFGAPYCYSGVYADTMPELKISGNVQTFTATQIKKVNAADLIGEGGKATVDALNTANGGATVWYTGNPFDGYPSLKPAGSLPGAYQEAYDGTAFANYNIYTGSNDQFGVYTTSLNLKNNPYLSIVFAFGKEGDVSYKENRANINVTVTGSSGTIYSGNVPAYVEGEYISGVNGWTNKKNAGRFHTLKLDAPIYELCGELTVTITYGDKRVENKVSVSGFGNELLNSYKRNPSDYYLNCAEAVKALLFYTQSLKARYGTKAQ